MTDLTDLVAGGIKGSHSWLKRPPKAMRNRKQLDDTTLPRRFRVLELRILGNTFQEIADAISKEENEITSVGAVYGWYQWALSTFFEEPAQEALKLDLARLDKLIFAWMPLAIGEPSADGKAREPDAKAADLVLKIMKQRQDLIGHGRIDNEDGIDEVLREAAAIADVLGIPVAQLLETTDHRVRAEFWTASDHAGPLVIDLPRSADTDDEPEDPTIG